MYTINDPMFALILRFVGGNRRITFRDDDFIKKQLNAIRAYVAQFPEEEQELRAIEWIETRAREYRTAWEKKIIDQAVSHDRCEDCPLAKTDDSKHCEVHDEWLKILQQYAAHQIDSRKYVKNALKLLSQHKKNLKIKLSQVPW